MKRDKIIYWIATGLVSLAMLSSGFMYLSGNPQIVEGFKLIGMPAYVITLLGVAKLLASITLVIPKFEKLKEWAYAGLTFNMLGAAWAHISTGTPFVSPLIFLVFLGVSYWFRMRIISAQGK